jgi:hypothetical protein
MEYALTRKATHPIPPSAFEFIPATSLVETLLALAAAHFGLFLIFFIFVGWGDVFAGRQAMEAVLNLGAQKLEFFTHICMHAPHFLEHF